MSDTNLYRASRQWAVRPDDQRFLTLEDLKASVASRKVQSWTTEVKVKDLRVAPDETTNALNIQLYSPVKRKDVLIEPTHWGFGQLSTYAGTPASYLRKLPAPLAAINLQWGLEHLQAREDALILGQTNGANHLRSLTSPSYGRIWDLQVVEAVEKVNRDGRWQVPANSASTQNTKRATTLYASDHDVFIFLVDPENPVEIGDEKLFRGFFTWNSEVGAATFGLTTFLYRSICDNRIVWGATDIRELRIKHTGGAPERFAYEGARYLKAYSEESAKGIAETVKKANQFELKNSDKKDGGWESWLKERGFTGTQAKVAIETAKDEEGEARSLWNIINGLTASARKIPFTDDRIKLETAAGNLLKYAK